MNKAMYKEYEDVLQPIVSLVNSLELPFTVKLYSDSNSLAFIGVKNKKSIFRYYPVTGRVYADLVADYTEIVLAIQLIHRLTNENVERYLEKLDTVNNTEEPLDDNGDDE